MTHPEIAFNSVTTTVKRAAAFAVLGSASLAAPIIGPPGAIAPFVLMAGYALLADRTVPGFTLLARPGDYEGDTLYGLAGFALAAAALGLLTLFGLPVDVFAATVCLLVFGNLGEQLAAQYSDGEFGQTAGFLAGGFIVGMLAWALSRWLLVAEIAGVPSIGFLAAAGAITAALLRSMLFKRDDPVVLLSVGLLLWVFVELGVQTTGTVVLLALAVTGALGYASHALDTASIPGLLTGMLLILLTMVLAGFGWFAVLIAFFGIGGLATKFRYEEKKRRGVAEGNEGARGTGNVLSNSAVALVAIIGYTASPDPLSLPSELFLFAFAASLATALGDTLSSEIGCVFDRPRLITTLEGVEPGTNGGVTWQGTLAGVVGSALIGLISLLAFETIWLGGLGVIVAAGILGMFIDSLLGATLEGAAFGNQAVNFLATLAGAAIGVWAAIAFGFVAF